MKDWEKRQVEREVKIALPPSTISWLMEQDAPTILYYFRLFFASNQISDAAKVEAAKILRHIMQKNPRVGLDDFVLFNAAVAIAPYLAEVR